MIVGKESAIPSNYGGEILSNVVKSIWARRRKKRTVFLSS